MNKKITLTSLWITLLLISSIIVFPASGDTVGTTSDGTTWTVDDDGGATFGAPVRINEVDGTVVDEPGSVDVIVSAIPEIGIKSISKGLGVTAVIENTGTADGEDVAWSISIDAPLMILGGETSGSIDVPAGGEVSVRSGFVLGFGPAAITVNAGDASGSESGTVLLIFILDNWFIK